MKKINLANYADIEKTFSEMKTYLENSDRDYTTERLCILGRETIQRFSEEYGISVRESPSPKTDGKTHAKVIPFVEIDLWYDARSWKFGIDGIFVYVRYLINFEGTDMIGYFSEKKTSDLYLYDDRTIYHEHLPYKWEDENPRPNKISVLTDKKLDGWRNWLLKRKDVAESEKARKENATEDFLRRLSEIDGKEHTEKRGYISKNGLRLCWEICSDGAVYSKIEVDYPYGSDKIDTFKKMCAGQL